MFVYQSRKSAECTEMTSELFARLIIDPGISHLIDSIRRLRAEGKDKGADLQKRQLPLLCFCAKGFDPTPAASDSMDGARKKGQAGCWRVQQAVRLNGLYMLDVDHMEKEPREAVVQWAGEYYQMLGLDNVHPDGQLRRFAEQYGIVLIHVTSSGRGLRLVAKADKERGNLYDNAAWLAKQLGVEADKSCKDASRGSYAPTFNDIIYINKDELFNYENQEYDKIFGPLYRRGCSAAIGNADNSGISSGNGDPRPGVHALRPGCGTADGEHTDLQRLDKAVEEGYHGASYRDIIERWFADNSNGAPAPGDRHRVLLKLATHIRYICNNNPEFLMRALAQHDACASYQQDEPEDYANIASSACKQPEYRGLPKRLQMVLASVGVRLDEPQGGVKSEDAPAVDYVEVADRLEPLLADTPGLREAVMHLPRQHWMGAVLAAGAMMGTYLTRCWWEHFDGRYYRLSYIVYIIGQAASGKSFLTELDELLMASMQSSDRLGRAAEEQYNEACKRRKASEKAPEQPKIPVRYCPTSTSNAVFFRRLKNAIEPNVIDPNTGEPLRMHIITVESELKTASREWKKGYAAKGDLELKAFHNELAGVDYANIESANGIMQVNWNQVMSGTVDSLSDKVKPSTILDGFVTRLCLFLMPENDYQMIERRTALRNNERDCMLRQLGMKLEQVKGELRVPRLVDFCYDYEAELTRQADMEQDRCLDYFRKRIPVIMMRYALVRIVLRQIDKAIKGEELTVDDTDLEFARLIGDWCLKMQVHMFGSMVLDALQREKEAFKPRGIYNKTAKKLEQLGGEFTKEDIISLGLAKDISCARATIGKWIKKGYVEKIGEKYRRCATLNDALR